MSRIDEALRRAAGRTGERVAAAGATPSGVAVLDAYPPEGPGRTGSPDIGSRNGGALPRLRTMQAAAPPSAFQGKLVTNTETSRVSIEQYRRLAATLHDLQVARGLKVLMVTSALPGEGKTLTAVNLALTLSESYARRVLLIDADLRRPNVHNVFGIPGDKGLSDALKFEGDAFVVNVSSRLAVLPGGRPDANPTAALTSDRMAAFLEHSVSTFDWVLLDAPPVALLPDAQLLARLTGAVLLVIRAGATSYPLIERVVTELGRDCIVGSILNSVDEETIPATEYYHHYDDSAPRA